MKGRHDGVTRRLLVTLLCNAIAVSALAAQAGSVLALAPGSARAAGMGGAGAALLGDAGGIFANPPAPATIPPLLVGASDQTFPSGSEVSTGAGAPRGSRFPGGAGAPPLGPGSTA